MKKNINTTILKNIDKYFLIIYLIDYIIKYIKIAKKKLKKWKNNINFEAIIYEYNILYYDIWNF